MIRILIAEDQGMVRGALASLLELEPDFEVVAQVARGDEVLGVALRVRPDVALLDIEMPGSSGLDAAELLAAALPACRVLILTTFGRPGYLRRAMEDGAAGFVLKDAPATELSAAIRRALGGERVVDPGLAAAALSQGECPLTPREHEVTPPGTTPPWPSWPRRSTCHPAPCATTCHRGCRSSMPATEPKRSGRPRSGAGCKPAPS
jgi:two-component system response regulator DesR